MPGSVPVASPVESFPTILYRSLTEVREYRVDANVYALGEVQAAALVTTSRKAWHFTARVSAADLATLYAFWVAMGKTTPFYFAYRGVTYAVVFTTAWQQTQTMGRTDVAFDLVEVS